MSRLSSTATRSLTFRYMLALVAIGMTCLASQLVIQTLLSNAESHSHVVNLAGRQRMLSQRIAKLSHQIAGGESDTSSTLCKELETSIDDFRSAGQTLRSPELRNSNKQVANAAVIAQLDALQPNLESLVDAASQVIVLSRQGTRDDAALQPLIEQIDVAEQDFLAKMDDAVKTIAEHSSQEIRKLIWTEKTITVCTLLLLVLEALFVFRPAVKRVSQSILGLRVALSQARSERQNAENAIAERNLALTAAAMDLKRLSGEIDSLLVDQMNVGATSDTPRFRMLMSHVQSTLGKLTNLTDGTDDPDNPLLVSRTSPRSLVKDAVHRFQGQFEEDVNVHITMDDRLPASLLVDEQLFRDSIIYLLQSVFDSSGPEVAVHVGYDDRELRLVVEIFSKASCDQTPFENKAPLSLLGQSLANPPSNSRPEIESLDLLLAKRTLERLGGKIQANQFGDRIKVLLPLDENKRMTLFVDQDECVSV
jgi:hypothetical protein